MRETTEFLRNAGGSVAPKEAGEPAEFVQGFTADNTTPLIGALTTSYPLQDLTDYFGEIPQNESKFYGMDDAKGQLDIQHVNEKFPIECLRNADELGQMGFYVVYSVAEGGYFYVFWSLFDDSQPSAEQNYSALNLNNATVSFTAYLAPSSLRTASDFDSLQIGVSTAEDVAKIDPAFEIMFQLSSRTPSFSLLSDGSIMEICYFGEDSIASRSDLVVESLEVYPREEGMFHLGFVFPEDLP